MTLLLIRHFSYVAFFASSSKTRFLMLTMFICKRMMCHKMNGEISCSVNTLNKRSKFSGKHVSLNWEQMTLIQYTNGSRMQSAKTVSGF